MMIPTWHVARLCGEDARAKAQARAVKEAGVSPLARMCVCDESELPALADRHIEELFAPIFESLHRLEADLKRHIAEKSERMDDGRTRF